MVNRVDGVILGVGIVVLVASVVGVILYDEQSPQQYTLSWTQSEAIDLDEQTASGGTGEYTFETNVSQQHLADAEFNVEVTASGTNVADSSVSVEVLTPEGETAACEFTVAGGQTESTSDCTAELSLNPEPSPDTTMATNRSEAEQQARDDAQLDNGTGVWETTVSIETDSAVREPDYEVALTPTVFTWEVTANQGGPGGQVG